MKVLKKDIEKFSEMLMEDKTWEDIVKSFGKEKACKILEILVRKGEVEVLYPASEDLSKIEIRFRNEEYPSLSQENKETMEALRKVIKITKMSKI